jgi:predicted dehydrogenase
MSSTHETNGANRRDFLKVSAAAAAGALVLPAGVYAAGNDTIKVGLVGCGGRGKGAANNVLHSAKGVKIVAVGDVFANHTRSGRNDLTKIGQEESVKQLGNSVDLPEDRCFTGLDAYKKVINHPEVNYVILATPPGFRPLHIAETVNAGKNLFTEKPVAVDGPGIRQVLDAYDQSMKKGLHIAAGTQRRHQAGYIETLKRIHGGAIGDPILLRVYWNGSGIWFKDRQSYREAEQMTELAYQMHNWYHFLWLCGDHVVEQHVHNLDVANWVMKDHPVKAWGMGGRQGGHGGRPNGELKDVGNIFDHFTVEFEYASGARMISQCRHIPGCWNSISETVYGTKGVSQVNAYRVNKEVVGGRGEKDPYTQEHTDLIESIRAGTPLNELKNVVESTATAIMARTAGYIGGEVTWEAIVGSKTDLMDEANLKWDSAVPVTPVPVPGKTKLS